MGKNQLRGMECLTADKFHVRIVEGIPDEGKTQIFHMNPYLMGTACFQMQTDQAVPVFFLYNAVVGDGGFPVFKVDRPLDDRTGLSSQGAVIVPEGGSTLPRTMPRYSR